MQDRQQQPSIGQESAFNDAAGRQRKPWTTPSVILPTSVLSGTGAKTTGGEPPIPTSVHTS